MIPFSDLVNGADYALSYSAGSFTIAAPGECAGKAATCGHARVWVDDMACNDQPDSLPYNAEGASPLDLGFDYCAMLLGGHDIKLVLYGEDNAPFLDPASAAEVSDTAHVTILSSGAGGSGGSGGSGGQAGAP
jgi:hypothetical protein